MKRPMILFVRDREGFEWSFPFRGDHLHIEEWRAAGLQVYEVAATVPAWAARLGLARVYAKFQAAWQWMRMW